jgi:transcriptional regulator with XRE-family HTH domain
MTGKMTGQPKNERARVVGWSQDAADRLKEAVKAYGPVGSVAELVGIKRQSLSEILQGRATPTVGTFEKLCELLKVRPAFILVVEDVDEDVAEPSEDMAGVVAINEINLAYGMGATFIDGGPVKETVRYFALDWLRVYTQAPPSQLRFAPGRGNSMSPTIDDGDIMLIDLSEKTPSFADLIWVCAIGEMGMVKRLSAKPGGAIVIKSDNPSVPDDIVHDGEIHVVGRVVAVIKRV